MKFMFFLSAGLLLLIGQGCYTYRSAQDHERDVADSLRTPPMTTDDVVAMAKAGVSDSVIIDQMEATNSYFELSPDQIIQLRKAGVSDAVVEAMIKPAPRAQGERGRSYSGPYPYYPYDYYYPGYYYPRWYPFGFGFGYRYLRPFHAHPFGVHPFRSFNRGYRPFGTRR